MGDNRPAGYPKLTDYIPTKFMLPTSHYDEDRANRAVRFIENLKHTKGRRKAAGLGSASGCCRGRSRSFGIYSGSLMRTVTGSSGRLMWRYQRRMESN